MSKVLVGVPVFRIPELTRQCLASLVFTPADVLVIDNNADADVRAVLRSFSGRIRIISNTENKYCNGAWNQIMEYGITHNYDVIGLGSSDVNLHQGWYNVLCARVVEFKDEVLIPSIGPAVPSPDFRNAERTRGGMAGYFSFLPREAVQIVHPIPSGLRMWFGDQYMFEKLSALGWSITILNEMRAIHQQSAVTAATPEAYAVIEQDKLAWKELCQRL